MCKTKVDNSVKTNGRVTVHIRDTRFTEGNICVKLFEYPTINGKDWTKRLDEETNARVDKVIPVTMANSG